MKAKMLWLLTKTTEYNTPTGGLSFFDEFAGVFDSREEALKGLQRRVKHTGSIEEEDAGYETEYRIDPVVLNSAFDTMDDHHDHNEIGICAELEVEEMCNDINRANDEGPTAFRLDGSPSFVERPGYTGALFKSEKKIARFKGSCDCYDRENEENEETEPTTNPRLTSVD